MHGGIKQMHILIMTKENGYTVHKKRPLTSYKEHMLQKTRVRSLTRLGFFEAYAVVVVGFAVGECCTFGPPWSSVLWLPGRRREVSTTMRRATLDTEAYALYMLFSYMKLSVFFMYNHLLLSL